MQRFVFIDGLRAIAALSVVLFHSAAGDHIPIISATLPGPLRTILEHSNAGVAIFFVLSGFVIAHTLHHVQPSFGAVGRFMLKRSLRLDPPYWAIIALTVAIGLTRGTTYSMPQILAHLVYLQDLLGFQPVSPIFWTLCLELQFYLVFALLLLARSQALFLLAFIASIPLSCVPIMTGLFTDLWYGFLLGAGAYMSWRAQDLRALAFFPYALAFVLLGAVRRDLFMEACAVTALVVLYATMTAHIYDWLSARIFQFLGAISYSLYLVHNPATGATFRAGYALLGHSIWSEVICWIGAIAASIGFAWVTWFLIERPSIRLSQMVSARRGISRIDVGRA